MNNTDTERLDFLIANPLWTISRRPLKRVQFRMRYNGWDEGDWHPTARAAIDIAMAETKEAEK